MKKRILLLLLFCLLLAGCAQEPPEDDAPAPKAPGVPAPTVSALEGESRALDRLTVELVVDWEDTDRVLESQKELERLLREALAVQAWAVEEVQITISTAGGPTGDALAAGGVDAACLPEEDFAARRGDASAVLAGSGAVFAVTGAREEIDGGFREALAEALLNTEQGAAFLGAYSPDRTYTAVPEGA